MTIDVIALPGGVMPAAQRYASLAAMLNDSVRLHTKDLEVYAGDSPPHGYSIQLEVDAVAAYADSLGLRRFHLLGYSGGGFIALAFAGAHPERLRSLALFEPAAIPGGLTAEESEGRARLNRGLAGLSGAEFMRAFVALQVKDGVVVQPPEGPPPPWMAKRPAGITALMAGFAAHPFDRNSLRQATCPVFYGYGDLTDVQEELKAGVIARLFADVHIHRYAGVHHFVPAEAIYTADHVASLHDLWARSEGTT